MQLAQLEQAYDVLGHVLTSHFNEPDPKVRLQDVATALLTLGVKPCNVDLDRILDEIQQGVMHLEWLAPEGHYDMQSRGVRMSALMISRSFRKALTGLEVSEMSCQFGSLQIARLFSQVEIKMLLQDSKVVQKNAGEVLYDQLKTPNAGYLSVLLNGGVNIAKVHNEVLLESISAREGLVWGGYRVLTEVRERRHDNDLNPVFKSKTPGRIRRTASFQEGPGLVITADEACKIIQIRSDKLEAVCSKAKKIGNWSRDSLLLQEMVEAPNRNLSEIKAFDFGALLSDGDHVSEVTDMKRKTIRDAVSLLEKVWATISQGATTVPRGTIEIIQTYLGECGQQTYNDVLKPMYTNASMVERNEFRAEIFWFCWSNFLAESMTACHSLASPQHGIGSDTMNDGDAGPRAADADASKDPADDDGADLSIFEEKETLLDRLVWFLADHRISERFLQVSPQMLESEYLRVVGGSY